MPGGVEGCRYCRPINVIHCPRLDEMCRVVVINAPASRDVNMLMRKLMHIGLSSSSGPSPRLTHLATSSSSVSYSPPRYQLRPRRHERYSAARAGYCWSFVFRGKMAASSAPIVTETRPISHPRTPVPVTFSPEQPSYVVISRDRNRGLTSPLPERDITRSRPRV